MKYSLVAILLLLVFVVALGVPLDVSAQGVSSVLDQQLVPCQGDNCDLCYLVQLGDNIIDFAVAFTVFVGTIAIAIAGFMYITAGGDVAKIKKAHGMFWKVLIGMIIVMAAWLIVDTIMKTFLNQSYGPWNDIVCSVGQSGIGDFPVPNGPGSGSSNPGGSGSNNPGGAGSSGAGSSGAGSSGAGSSGAGSGGAGGGGSSSTQPPWTLYCAASPAVCGVYETRCINEGGTPSNNGTDVTCTF